MACLWLTILLGSLWEERIMTKEQVKKLVEEIEEKDRIVFTSKEDIFDR
jgi:hypothetical protein